MTWIGALSISNDYREKSIETGLRMLKLKRSSGRGGSLIKRRRRLRRKCRNFRSLKKFVRDKRGKGRSSWGDSRNNSGELLKKGLTVISTHSMSVQPVQMAVYPTKAGRKVQLAPPLMGSQEVFRKFKRQVRKMTRRTLNSNWMYSHTTPLIWDLTVSQQWWDLTVLTLFKTPACLSLITKLTKHMNEWK
jgi:hypothetical protein